MTKAAVRCNFYLQFLSDLRKILQPISGDMIRLEALASTEGLLKMLQESYPPKRRERRNIRNYLKDLHDQSGCEDYRATLRLALRRLPLGRKNRR